MTPAAKAPVEIDAAVDWGDTCSEASCMLPPPEPTALVTVVLPAAPLVFCVTVTTTVSTAVAVKSSWRLMAVAIASACALPSVVTLPALPPCPTVLASNVPSEEAPDVVVMALALA